MGTVVDYFDLRHNRWITIYTKKDQEDTHDFAGWVRAVDNLGIVIFGSAVSIITDAPPSPPPDSIFVPWSEIALIVMDQERETR